MSRNAGELSEASLRSACAPTCAGPNLKGTSLHVRWTSVFVRLVKLAMKMQQTPMVPKNVWTSERSLQVLRLRAERPLTHWL
jgi:hypothetical protein